MGEVLAFEISEGVCLLLGFTLLAYHWGEASRHRHRQPDPSKFAAFLCLGLAWLFVLCSRLAWDIINTAFVAYIEQRSPWGKAAYSWYSRNQHEVGQVLASLSIGKLCLFTVAFLINLRRWFLVLSSESNPWVN